MPQLGAKARAAVGRTVLGVSQTIKTVLRSQSENLQVDDQETASPQDLSSSASGQLLLGELPEDILRIILAFADAPALLRCKKVCRRLRRLVDVDIYAQYTLELAANGVIEGPAAARLCVQDRLVRLREYSERFCSAEFSCESDYPLGDREDPEDDKAYPLTVWDNTHFSPAVAYRLQTSLDRSPRGSLVVYDAPAAIDNEGEVRNWRRSISVEKQVVAVDVTQDLAIMHDIGTGHNYIDGGFSNKIYILSLDKWTAHPDAALPTLDLVEHEASTPTTCATRINDAKVYGRYVGWNILCHGDHESNALEIWDWQKGCRLWHGHFPRYASYTFLDSEHIVVIDKVHEGEILIYRFADLEDPDPCLSTAYTAAPSRRTTLPLFVLNMPPGSHWCRIDDTSAPPSPSTAPASALFWPDPAQRTVPITFTISQMVESSELGGYWDCECVLLVPYRTFQRHLAQPGADLARFGGVYMPTVHWANWGRQGALLLKNQRVHGLGLPGPARTVRHHPFGSRMPMVVEEHGELRVLTFDLNPWARLHRAHAGCRRMRETKTGIEVFNEFHKKYRFGPGALQTMIPRVVFRGPVLRDLGECPNVVSMNSSGFTVVYKDQGSLYWISKIERFYVSRREDDGN